MTIQELEQCVDEYGREIYSFCRQVTGNVQEGEDLYQDTFMKAVELADRIDRNKNPKSYLLSIAIRLWKNKRRKNAWRQRIAGMDSLDDESGVLEKASLYRQEEYNNSPEEMILGKEQAYQVRSCIASLPDKYQLLLYLYYTAELSVHDIGICIKVPEGTVKSRLHKARIMVKEKLEVAGYDE